MRKRTSAAHKAQSRSRKSSFTCPRKGQLENLFAHLPCSLRALIERDAIPKQRVVVRGRGRLTGAKYTRFPARAAPATLLQRFTVVHPISLASPDSSRVQHHRKGKLGHGEVGLPGR